MLYVGTTLWANRGQSTHPLYVLEPVHVHVQGLGLSEALYVRRCKTTVQAFRGTSRGVLRERTVESVRRGARCFVRPGPGVR